MNKGQEAYADAADVLLLRNTPYCAAHGGSVSKYDTPERAPRCG